MRITALLSCLILAIGANPRLQASGVTPQATPSPETALRSPDGLPVWAEPGSGARMLSERLDSVPGSSLSRDRVLHRAPLDSQQATASRARLTNRGVLGFASNQHMRRSGLLACRHKPPPALFA